MLGSQEMSGVTCQKAFWSPCRLWPDSGRGTVESLPQYCIAASVTGFIISLVFFSYLYGVENTALAKRQLSLPVLPNNREKKTQKNTKHPTMP